MFCKCICIFWVTSDFRERLDGDRGRPVTLERQTTTRRRLVLGHTGLATQDAVLARGQLHLLQHRKKDNTPRVSREEGGGDERLVLTDSPVTTRTRSRTQRQMVQLTLTGEEVTQAKVRCECGKICKNKRGLKIQQSRCKDSNAAHRIFFW